MSSPRQERHKCSLFEEEIPAITYNSWGTYTLGVLQQSTILLSEVGSPLMSSANR
jgi:hypothetical protein